MEGIEREKQGIRQAVKEKWMKKFYLPIFICFLLCGLTIFVGCGGKSLSAPSNVAVDEPTLTLTWDEVKYASYYTVSIDGEGTSKQKDSSKNTYSLETLEEGTYTIKVKAKVSGSDGEHSDSPWSKTIVFTREHETGLTFKLINGGSAFEVSGLGSATGDIVVPNVYRGIPVTRIGERAFYTNKNNTVTSVRLSENITEIGAQAFTNCSFLKEINFPSGLTFIGAQAFQSCRALSGSLVIPDGVKEIGAQAFEFCGQLTDITLGKGIKSIPTAAFSACSSLKSIVIPDNVKTIGDSAFAKCTNLSSVSFGKGVTEIGNDAFRQCIALPSVEIAATKIGDNAFTDCFLLQSLDLSNSVREIGSEAFYGCLNLKDVRLGNGIGKIARNAFLYTALWEEADDMVTVGNWFLGCKEEDASNYEIADGTIGIADYAFYGVKNFPDLLTIPNSVELIGEGAFYGCSKLINVAIGSGAIELGAKAFYQCTGLTKVFLGSYDRDAEDELGGSSLESIGNSAFNGCSSLKSITIPATVTTVGSYAFLGSGLYQNASREVYAGNWLVGCKDDGGYGSVTIREGTVGIANYAFYLCKTVTEVTIPDSVKTIGRSAFYDCTNLSKVRLPSNLEVIEDYTFYRCTALQLPVLPDTLVSIGRSAFYKCNLGSSGSDTDSDTLVIPDGVKTIGDYAFYDCGFTYLDPDAVDYEKIGGIDILILGTGVEEIGNNAFAKFTSLKRVTFGSNVKTVGEKAFYQCVGLESVSFGNSLQTVGTKAFYGCSALKEAILPESVGQINSYAFYRCSSLSRLDLGGTEEIGDYAFFGCASLSNLTLGRVTKIGTQAFRNCVGLTSVILRDSVTTIGSHAFYGCQALTFYTERSSVGGDWDARWNSSYRPVVWGCSVSEEGYLLSFVKTSLSVTNLNASNALSAPLREGYVFAGWSSVQNGETEYQSDGLDEVLEGTTLYAVWRAE